MAYVPPQTLTQLNADRTALVNQITTLKGLIYPVPAGVNSRDIQLMQIQVGRLNAVIATIDRRIKRAS